MCCLLICCKEKSNNEVIISGQLENVEDGVVMKLMIIGEGELVDVQSDTITNGNFSFCFADTLNQPKQMIIMGEGDGFPPTWLDIWVVPGAEINITGKDKLIRSWEVNSSVPEQIELNKYNVRISQYEKITQSIMRETFSYFDEINKYPEKSETLSAIIDSLYVINDSISRLIMETEITIMEENKTYSPVWMGKLERYASSLKFTNLSEVYIEKIKLMYEGMSDELKSTETGQAIQENLYSPL